MDYIYIGGQLDEHRNAFLATCPVVIYTYFMLLLVILVVNKMMMMMMMKILQIFGMDLVFTYNSNVFIHLQ